MLDLTVTLHTANSACRRFTLRLAKDESHEIRIRCDLARGEMVFDRSRVGSQRDIAHTRHVKVRTDGEDMTLRVLLDKESVELFADGGLIYVTRSILADRSKGVRFESEQASLTLKIEELQESWSPEED